ncbi:MAG TPA: phosphotransferase [Thermomicrobiales bacterium]|nr:phosphotransferase [Thermomicrobiales bacterium]
MSHDPSHPHRLPVARSVFVVEALAGLLAAEYGLADVRCQLIKGTIRDTYAVATANEQYVFSIYRHGHRTMEESAAEADLLDHLAAGNVPVAPAIRRVTGEWLLPIFAPEGVRHGVLFRFVPGRHLDRQPEPALAARYGRAIASIHARADDGLASLPRPHLDIIDMMDRALDALANVVPHRHRDLAYLQDVAARLAPGIGALPMEPPGYGIVHGDVIPSNAQVTPEDQVVVLDFDFCGYGWRAYDVATFLGEMRFWSAPAAAEAAFLAGYEDVRTLAIWEWAALPALEVARHVASLGTPAIYVNDWGSAYLTDGLFDRLVATIQEAAARLG